MTADAPGDAEPTYAERVALYARLPPAFSLEELFGAGAALGFEAFTTMSCLRAYQLAELVVQRDDRYVKHGETRQA